MFLIPILYLLFFPPFPLYCCLPPKYQQNVSSHLHFFPHLTFLSLSSPSRANWLHQHKLVTFPPFSLRPFFLRACGKTPILPKIILLLVLYVTIVPPNRVIYLTPLLLSSFPLPSAKVTPFLRDASNSNPFLFLKPV